MKYIRTKDGIYNYSNNNKFAIQNFIKCGYKFADTIEELCDEFVSVRDNWHDHWDNFEEPKTLCSESEIYGAIWTDKGLIYVAKMNEKGELELL